MSFNITFTSSNLLFEKKELLDQRPPPPSLHLHHCQCLNYFSYIVANNLFVRTNPNSSNKSYFFQINRYSSEQIRLFMFLFGHPRRRTNSSGPSEQIIFFHLALQCRRNIIMYIKKAFSFLIPNTFLMTKIKLIIYFFTFR